MDTAFLAESIALLSRTPAALDALLRGLPDGWLHATDGPGTWSAFDVLGHLIHGERTDWIPRIEIILEYGPSRPFEPFDREAHFAESAGKTVPQLLDEFATLRQAGLARLGELALGLEQLERQGTHPAFGPVTLRQLIATWTVHDLTHIQQISRTMGRRYRAEVGPWVEYISIFR